MSKKRGIIGVCWAKKVTDWEGAWKTGPATVGLQNCKESSFYTCISYIWYAWSTSQAWKKWPGKSWNERESHRKRKTEKTVTTWNAIKRDRNVWFYLTRNRTAT